MPRTFQSARGKRLHPPGHSANQDQSKRPRKPGKEDDYEEEVEAKDKDDDDDDNDDNDDARREEQPRSRGKQLKILSSQPQDGGSSSDDDDDDDDDGEEEEEEEEGGEEEENESQREEQPRSRGKQLRPFPGKRLLLGPVRGTSTDDDDGDSHDGNDDDEEEEFQDKLEEEERSPLLGQSSFFSVPDKLLPFFCIHEKCAVGQRHHSHSITNVREPNKERTRSICQALQPRVPDSDHGTEEVIPNFLDGNEITTSPLDGSTMIVLMTSFEHCSAVNNDEVLLTPTRKAVPLTANILQRAILWVEGMTDSSSSHLPSDLKDLMARYIVVLSESLLPHLDSEEGLSQFISKRYKEEKLTMPTGLLPLRRFIRAYLSMETGIGCLVVDGGHRFGALEDTLMSDVRVGPAQNVSLKMLFPSQVTRKVMEDAKSISVKNQRFSTQCRPHGPRDFARTAECAFHQACEQEKIVFLLPELIKAVVMSTKKSRTIPESELQKYFAPVLAVAPDKEQEGEATVTDLLGRAYCNHDEIPKIFVHLWVKKVSEVLKKCFRDLTQWSEAACFNINELCNSEYWEELFRPPGKQGHFGYYFRSKKHLLSLKAKDIYSVKGNCNIHTSNLPPWTVEFAQLLLWSRLSKESSEMVHTFLHSHEKRKQVEQKIVDKPREWQWICRFMYSITSSVHFSSQLWEHVFQHVGLWKRFGKKFDKTVMYFSLVMSALKEDVEYFSEMGCNPVPPFWYSEMDHGGGDEFMTFLIKSHAKKMMKSLSACQMTLAGLDDNISFLTTYRNSWEDSHAEEIFKNIIIFKKMQSHDIMTSSVSEYAGYVISDLIEDDERRGVDMEGNVEAQLGSVQNSGTLQNVHTGQEFEDRLRQHHGRLLQLCKTLQQCLLKSLDSLNELNPHETRVLQQELRTLERICQSHENNSS